MSTWKRTDLGFTLLEVMIALAIIAVSFVSLLALRNRDILLSGYSKDMVQATLLARGKMTDIELAGFPDLGEQSGDFTEAELAGDTRVDSPPSRFHWKESVVTPELTPTLANLVREVHVTVSWSDQKERLELVAYIFNTH